MNLSDKEILELNGLCNAVADGTLTGAQKARLSVWLSASVEARKFYLRHLGVSASLMSYASEMQSDSVGAPRGETAGASRFALWWRWLAGSLAAATAIALLAWVHLPKQNPVAARPLAGLSVARLTGAKGCNWNTPRIVPGSELQKGQELELAGGFAEITFDSGARVVLQGPASLNVKSAWAATLNSGTLKASVPPEAVGFSISNPNVDIVDLGTEFTMSADAGGAAEVLVLKGKVEADSKAATNRQTILLTARESRRFESSGVSSAEDAGRKFAELTRPLTLDHFTTPADCMHWSFDESNGTLFAADLAGLPVSTSDLRVKLAANGTEAAAHAPGWRLGGLRLDGTQYARAALPGLSQYAAHTVAFWVNVPKNAILSSAYAMVAWGVNNEKLGKHPIHIAWNRNPAEGTVGVLRTDYGGGFALGSTPLRDGQWHHIAVVLVPTDDATKTLEVKQYVDGRLEGEGQSSPPGSEVFKQLDAADAFALSDLMWLGCRLGTSGVRAERFTGQMDELFIANRALEPREIVQLMNDNKLETEVASSHESE
jgi:hypothetical protein